MVCAMASVAPAQAVRRGIWTGLDYSYTKAGGQASGELTIAQQRKLGLSGEQIKKIAEARRDLEKQRLAIDEQLKKARAAAAAANAEVARLSQESRTILTLKIRKVYESVMTDAQRKAWKEQQLAEQAKQWLRSYKQWLSLTDAQVEDIALLLVPVFGKYEGRQDELEDVRERLAELRRADKIDIAAIEEAEKQVAELSKPNVSAERQKELSEAMRAGLMPDQLEKFDRVKRR